MINRSAGPEIVRLIDLLAKLPGLGPRSARRAALHLMKKRDQLLTALAAALAEALDAGAAGAKKKPRPKARHESL